MSYHRLLYGNHSAFSHINAAWEMLFFLKLLDTSKFLSLNKTLKTSFFWANYTLL